MRNIHVWAIIFVLFLVFGFLVFPASAEDEDDWESLTVTLGLEDPAFSNAGYTVEALEFDGYGMVLLRVSRNGTPLGDVVLDANSSSWSCLDNEQIRLKAGRVSDLRKLPMFGSRCSPKAEIIFDVRKADAEIAALLLDLEVDEDEYLLDRQALVELELRNAGEAKAGQIRLEVDPDGLIQKDQPPEVRTLGAESEKTWDLRFRFPDTIKKCYNVTVKASWVDGSGLHSVFESVEVKVKEPLKIHKSTGTEAWIQDPVYTTVSVENVQTRAVRVKLFDMLPVPFSFLNCSDAGKGPLPDTLIREFVLAPDEKKTFSYTMSSGHLGAHRVPEARAYAEISGQIYTVCSDTENNVIRLYRRIFYKEYDSDEGTKASPSTPDKSEHYSAVKIKVNIKQA